MTGQEKLASVPAGGAAVAAAAPASGGDAPAAGNCIVDMEKAGRGNCIVDKEKGVCNCCRDETYNCFNNIRVEM